MKHVQKETAVLLKGKGFDYTHPFANKDINGISFDIPNNIYPTLYEAAEWLRAKGVHVDSNPSIERHKWVSYVYVIEDGRMVMIEKAMLESTHDEALEAGIVHALKNYVK
jgi:hypothetical protein